ncbi:hypothetical protein ACC713_30385, partial [Rhizobium johnstonii]|uniref:hypothetical protein n=1 Tax=Rhizobium johnstonii TaxID=3019933 RepID=UPI003F9EB8D5
SQFVNRLSAIQRPTLLTPDGVSLPLTVQSLFTAKYAAQGKVHGSGLSFFDRNLVNSVNIVFWSPEEGYFESIPCVSEDLASIMDDEIMNMYRLITEVAAPSPVNEIRKGAGEHLVFDTPTLAPSQLTAYADRDSFPNPELYASYLIESELVVRVWPGTYALRLSTPVNPDDLKEIATALNGRYGAKMFRVVHADPDR